MSWRDIFYPEIPEKRDRLIRKSQELQELMKYNFQATNQLIETLKKHLCLSFSPIYLNEKATVRKNCDVLIDRIRQIQAEVEKIDKKLKDKLEPALYEKLKNMSLSDYENQQVSKALKTWCGVTAIACTIPLVGWLIKNGNILTNITSTFIKIGTGLLATVLLGVAFIGIEMIIQAILGKIEHAQLEKALKEYDEALEEFRPASEIYQDSITYIRIKLEMTE